MIGKRHLRVVEPNAPSTPDSGGPASSITTESNVKRSTTAMAFLAVGAVLAGALGWNTLTKPVVGSAAVLEGTPLASLDSVTLPTGRNAVVPAGPNMLVLWDAGSTEPSAELQATYVVNMLGHFGPVSFAGADTVDQATLDANDLVVYAGEAPGSTISPALAQRVIDGTEDTLWLGPNLVTVVRDDPAVAADWGWVPTDEAVEDAIGVTYDDLELPRDTLASPLAGARVSDPSKATVLATAITVRDTLVPYAIRSGRLTWFAEIPSQWQIEADRSLVLADVLFDLLDPDRVERHRGLVRLEDIGPWADPDVLRSIADGLYERGIPFSMAVYPIWRDPDAQYQLGTDIRLADRPDVVDAIRYAQEHGGTVLMHGVTHQHGEAPNPYGGTSGEDFEFYLTHIDENDNVIMDSPVPGDSAAWMRSTIQQGFAEFADAGLDAPTIFEFPHYAGSAVDYAAIEDVFDARYERTSFPTGMLSGRAGSTNLTTNTFPYPVIDIYGELVIPENLGNVIPVGYNNNDPRDAAAIIENARRSLIVRDNVASFFFHPYLDPAPLFEIVDGMTDLGYQFVAPADVKLGD